MKTILEYLDLQVMIRPDKPAFCDENASMTFSEIDSWTKKTGTMLLAEGADREPVAVLLPRTAVMLATMLGVMRAGCAYVPMDREMGELRIRGIFGTVHPRFLIAGEEDRDFAEACGFTGMFLAVESIPSRETDLCALARVYEKTLDIDPAYIVFTSGSTGTPKGVCGKHSAIIDYAEQLTSVLRVSDSDVFGMQAPLYVDACLKEILSVLRNGASLWIIPKRLFAAPVALVQFLNAHAVTTICWVVPALTLISALHTFDEIVPRTLRTIAFGSEVFPVKQLHIWQSHVFARYINLYGPTECTGMSCWYEVNRPFSEGEKIPIGRPFNNTEILLLDGEKQQSEQGEICIRGVCLCHGYWNDPERTEKAFCRNPLRPEIPDRIYRTGDLGRWNEHGELEFIGRADNQIKHMGHRIELGELESAAERIAGVSGACAVFDPERRRLALAYTGDANMKTVSAELRTMVPEYMLPSRTVKLDAIPLTGNGKTDRKSVLALCFSKKNIK